MTANSTAPAGGTDTILVVGATGNQGGAVVDHLLAADGAFDVRGLTRTPDSEAARALARRGVDVRQGDLNDERTLRSPLDGVDAVVLVTNIWTAGFERSVRQAENAADAAVEAGVEHVVFSGAGYHDRDLGIAALEPAGEVERYLRSLDVPATVVRPVWFMHNLEPAFEEILDGTLALPVSEDMGLQMVAVDDVGRAVARVLARPEEFAGEGFDLAGDERTPREMARVLSEVTGADVQPVTVPTADAEEQMGEAMAELFRWFDDGGYSIDIERLERRLGFEFTGFRAYLEANGWADKRQPSRIPGLVKAVQGTQS